MPGSPCRTLSESHRFTAEYDALGERSDLDDVMIGVTTAIATRPDSFPIINQEKQIRLAKSVESAHAPPFGILFLIEDDNVVELLSIRILDESDEDFGD